MKTIDDLIKEIGINKSIFENYITFSDAYYNTFYISKKDKKSKRTIEAPNKELKTIQRWILKEYLEKIKVSDRANGFVPNRNIKRNSLFHLNRKYYLFIDIKDFFPSISQKQVFNSLQEYYVDKELSIKIAKLCTYKRRLPQGAPTSPMLSNIVFKKLDDSITKFCNLNLINYSRYADDLTFSSNNKSELTKAYHFVNDLLYKNGFQINNKKTRYLSGKGKIEITGVVVNSGKPTVSKKLKRFIRAEIFNYIINGKEINKNKISGHISFINSIEDDYVEKLKEYIRKVKKKKKLLVPTKNIVHLADSAKNKDDSNK